MELKEAFETIVNKINVNFKAGLYDINDASTILNAVTVVGKAISVEQPQDQPIEMSVEEPVKVTKSKK